MKKRNKRTARPLRKSPKRPLWRRLGIAACGAFGFWSLLPVLANGIFGVGVALPLAAAVVGIWLFASPHKKGWRRVVATVCVCGLCVCVVLGAVLSGFMLSAAAAEPAENSTVVVLGSKIYGDRPSRMLGDRLRLAAAYLKANPHLNCVVAGGLGKGETYTEAYVMQKYLVETCGIDPARIACEDASTDTRENLLYSLKIIEQRGWSKSVVTTTQIFHQYRARRWAQMAGAQEVGALACHTPFHLLLNYWVRECAAICRLWLIGR
ncbi:MAG: YdcF family protein [Clostridia bacterium]|nr:YdcF family protein [Clostridia bacterium]